MGDKEKCLEAGMNDYISKPIISENLIRMMDTWLNIIPKSKNQSITNKSNYKMEDIFDFVHLDKMSIGSVEFQKDLITTFIDDVDKRFEVLESHLNSGNLEKLVNEAHTIKGASLSVGANLVGRDALEVEMTGKQKDLSALPGKLSTLKESIDQTKDILGKHFSPDEV
jgi:HPt (histidine-containing phosphotransfer) domain-containing protein